MDQHLNLIFFRFIQSVSACVRKTDFTCEAEDIKDIAPAFVDIMAIFQAVSEFSEVPDLLPKVVKLAWCYAMAFWNRQFKYCSAELFGTFFRYWNDLSVFQVLFGKESPRDFCW